MIPAMELTANRRPFLYFPLRHHFEQNFHVRHRLDRYGSGRAMDFATATPDVIAQAISDELGRTIDYRPVETDGAGQGLKNIRARTAAIEGGFSFSSRPVLGTALEVVLRA